jgi:hypothetical protein
MTPSDTKAQIMKTLLIRLGRDSASCICSGSILRCAVYSVLYTVYYILRTVCILCTVYCIRYTVY